MVAEDADDYFLFLLSDANLGRYDVSPQEMGKVLRSEERVNAYAIFIAEPLAADWLKSELPFGASCMFPAKCENAMQPGLNETAFVAKRQAMALSLLTWSSYQQRSRMCLRTQLVFDDCSH